MPDLVKCQFAIGCTPQFAEFLTKDDKFSFERMRPVPRDICEKIDQVKVLFPRVVVEFDGVPLLSEEEYDWRVKNWGTKHEPHITEYLETVQTEAGPEVMGEIWTAWDPPEALFRYMHEAYRSDIRSLNMTWFAPNGFGSIVLKNDGALEFESFGFESEDELIEKAIYESKNYLAREAVAVILVDRGEKIPNWEDWEEEDEEDEAAGETVAPRVMADDLDVARLEAAQAAIRDEPQPEQAPWMVELGRDAHGAWATTMVSGVEVKFRWCPPGKFLMGSPATEEGRFGDEGPQHEVELTRGFWLGETPVTQSLWQAVMGSNPSGFQGGDRPVEQVSWEDCQQFMSRANGVQAGLAVRLPTEAEWEYACRAGTKGPTWLGKNSAAVLNRIAWYTENSGKQTQPVKRKESNPWGLYDMLGNVWEWCSDYSAGYGQQRAVDPAGPATGTGRVRRGGSWGGDAGRARAAGRRAVDAGGRAALGFRLARGQ